MISVPLVVKELRAGSRRWTTYLVRGLYVGIAALILYFFWESRRSEFETPSQYADLGRSLFSSLNVLQTSAALLGAMLGCSDSITSEVRSGTLGVILMTPLSPFRVVLAKWVAVLFQTFTILLCGAPALAICAYLGGVGPSDLLEAFGTCLLVAGFGAALALHASSTAAQPMRAFFSAFLRMILLYFIWQLGFWILIMGFGFAGASPVAFWVIQYGGLLFMLLFIPLLLRLAARNTSRRLSRPENADARDRDYNTRPSYYSTRLVIKGGVWENRPLLWKELATRSSGGRSRSVRILLGVLAGGVILISALAAGGRHTGAAHFWCFLLLLTAVAQGASLFAPDNSGRRWDMLLTSPATPSGIVGAKLAAGILAPEALASLALLLFPLALYAFLSPEGNGCFLALSSLLFLLFAYLLAAFCSLHARQTRTAFMVAGTIVALLLLLTTFSDSDSRFGRLLLALNPAAFFENSLLYEEAFYSGLGHFQTGTLPYFFFQWALYGGSSILLGGLLCLRFRRVASSF